jgi:long-chain acyl-CoA synthetase
MVSVRVSGCHSKRCKAMKHTEGTFKGFKGCNLYFQSWHAESPGAIVALIHGLGSHSGMLHNVVDYFLPLGYEVYAMDLRGHGRSDGQRGYINSWEEFREDVRAFLQHIRSHRAHCPLILWGHSLGGTIVLDYALHSPDDMQGMIVSAPALGKVSVPLHKFVVGQVLSQFLPHFRLPIGLSQSMALHDREALAAYLQDPLRHEMGSARLATEFISTVDWIYYHSAELRVPLLLLHGTADEITSPKASRAFFQRVLLPDKEHHEYPGADHELYEDLDRFSILHDIEGWLDRHLAQASRCSPFTGCMSVYSTDSPQVAHVLGKTIPSLLDAACERTPNATAFNQWRNNAWQTMSNRAMQTAVEALALGLRELGLNPGDRVAFLLNATVDFALADLGCLLAGLVDVPIDMTQTLENIVFAVRHSGAKALVVTNSDLLSQLLTHLVNLPELEHILVASEETALVDCDWSVRFLGSVQAIGEKVRSPERLIAFRQALNPQDLATIIYIPDSDNHMVGVMLTHENITGNALATFGEMSELSWGESEKALSFLPLTHIFARHLLYGHIYYGHSIYFSDPNRVVKHLAEIQPSVLAAVPLLLEKVYSQIRDRGGKLKQPWERQIFAWALKLAQRHELGQSTDDLYPILLKVADRLVFKHWRSGFGNKLKYLLCGGATLKPEITNVLTAAGLPVIQGYGLTQTAGVVCFNRPEHNRSGTVGEPVPGVELAIATDQEVLVRGPYITSGYFQNAAATAELIDAEGWLHTGDFGSMTTDGQLQITGLKKSLFKLCTGKYIAPQPIEARLKASSLVAQVMLVGSDRKFCGALIFPDFLKLRQQLEVVDLGNLSDAELLQHPCVVGWYQTIVDAANCHLPYWSIVKRFRLVNAELTQKGGWVNAQGELHRYRIAQRFALEVAAIYGDELPEPKRKQKVNAAVLPASIATISCPVPPQASCPIEAQSLHPRFTA